MNIYLSQFANIVKVFFCVLIVFNIPSCCTRPYSVSGSFSPDDRYDGRIYSHQLGFCPNQTTKEYKAIITIFSRKTNKQIFQDTFTGDKYFGDIRVKWDNNYTLVVFDYEKNIEIKRYINIGDALWK